MPVGMNASTLGAAGSARSTTASEFASRTFGSPRPGTFTGPLPVSRAGRLASASGEGNPKAGNGRPVPRRLWMSTPGTGLVLEHAHIRDVSFALVRRERQRKRQAPETHRGQDALLAHIDRCQAEIGLVEHIEDAAIRVQRQIARETVGEAVAVQVIDSLGSARGQIDQPHASGVALRGVDGVLRGEGQPHEDAVPLVILLHRSACSARSPGFGFFFLGASNWCTSQAPPLCCSSTVKENRSGPLLADTTVLPEGLMANPKGPGPATYCRPAGEMMRPPGRMLAAPGRRRAGRIPAGAEYSDAHTGRARKSRK